MTVRTPTYLKTLFENNDIPQASDYSDIFDSFLPISSSGKQTLDIALEITGDFTASGDIYGKNLYVNKVNAQQVSASAINCNTLDVSTVSASVINTNALNASTVSASVANYNRVNANMVSASGGIFNIIEAQKVSASAGIFNTLDAQKVSASAGFFNLFTSQQVSASIVNTNIINAQRVSASAVNITNVYKVGGTQVVGGQGTAVTEVSGGATVDAESRTAINAVIARLRTHGLIAP